MAPPKDIARSYPKRGLTADVGFRSEPKFCGDGSTSLDGTSDYLESTLTTALGSGFSVSLWFLKRTTTGSNNYLWSSGSSGGGSFISLSCTSSVNALAVYDQSLFLTSSLRANLNQWHHAVVTVGTGANSYTVYLDGIGDSLANTASPNITNGDFEIGRYSLGGTHYHDGLVSDVRIYDQVLTQDQVREIYNNPGLTIPTGLSASNLRHRYKLETDYVDTGASGDDLTAFGSPSFTVNRPQLPRGLDLTGNFNSPPLTFDGDCVKLDGSTQGATSATTYSIVTSGAKTTIAGWALPRSLTGGNQTLFGNAVNGGSDNFAIYQTGTNQLAAIAIYAGAATSVRAAAKNLDKNRWYFLAATFDYDTATLKFYVDGVEFSETPHLGYGGTGGLFEIGFRDDPGAGPIQFFDGNLANVMLIEDVLTQGEIVELMRDTSYAKAQTFGTVNRYYELDADFNDDTGSHNATSIGSPTFVNVKANPTRLIDPSRGSAMARVHSGRAVEFDGSADYLDIGRKDFGTGDFSISLWFYDQVSSGGNRSLYSKGTYNTVGGLLLYNVYGATGADQYILFRNDAQATGSFDSRITITSKATPNQWHHIAVTRTGGTVKGYFDGKLAASSTNFNPAWDINVAQNSFIGARDPSSPGSFWDGFISSVKVWDTVLTDAQVAEQFHKPEQVLPTGTSASNLDRYYPLSDYNDTGGTGGRYFQDMGADSKAAEDKGSASMEFAQPVPCPQLGLQQSASRIYFDGSGGGSTGPRWDASISTAPGATFSLAYWIWFDSSLPSYSMVTEGGGQHYIQTSGNIIWYDGGGTASFNGAFPSSKQDRWTHVVMTSTGSSPYAKCYVDGVEQTATGAAGGAGMTATSFSVFARVHTTTGFHKGFCANMAIFDDALSSAEVTELFNQGIGYDLRNDTGDYASSAELLNYWLFDDLNSVVDRKGSNNLTNSTSTSFLEMASFPENASGSTIVGDFTLKRRGVSVLNKTEDDNDVIAIIPASADVFPTSQGFTCSVWVRGRKTTGNAYIVATTNRSTDQRYSIYTQSGASNWGLEMPVSSSPTTADAAITYDPNEWACLSFTLDFGTNTVKMYTNGALQTTASRTLVVPTTFSDINVGGSGSAHATITGTTPVALFKVAQRTWSDDEVKRNYYSDLRLIKGLDNE